MAETAVLEARGMQKSFGHVQALRGATLRVGAGEVVGLVGDNGAGKSTLIKTLAGALTADDGEILVDGTAVRLTQPGDARRAGIETVYQDLALAPDLDAIANLYLGREEIRGGLWQRCGFLTDRQMRRRAPEMLDEIGIRLPFLDVPVASLSGGQRQLIAVARAMVWAKRVILMDEPTAALGVVQTDLVAQLIRSVSARGVSIIVISHNIPELLQIVDRIEVMRLGQVVASLGTDTTTTQIVSAMTGLDAEVNRA